MPIKIKYSLFFIITFLFSILIYYPSLTGLPIWDDKFGWFNDKAVGDLVNYSLIWTKYAWPVTVSYHRFIFKLFGEEFWIYHSINLILHFINSLLLFNLLRIIKFQGKTWVFLFFLVHPANVITVAWMIQVKTLFNLMFLLIAVQFYVLSKNDFKNKIPSILAFILSILSKSSSITAPIILLIFKPRDFLNKKNRPIILLVVLICLLAGIKLFNSKMVQTSLSSQVNHTTIENKSLDLEDLILFKPILILKTTRYYFWQSYLPLNNIPVKNLSIDNLTPWDFLHLLFILILAGFFWEHLFVKLILAGYILLIPFLGFIPANFMAITWISDQHLYLALPFFLMAFVNIVYKIPTYRTLPLTILLIFFSMQTMKAANFYKNEAIFYQAILKVNPTSLAIVVNLIIYYLENHQKEEARNLIVETEKSLKVNPYKMNDSYNSIYLTYKTELLGLEIKK